MRLIFDVIGKKWSNKKAAQLLKQWSEVFVLLSGKVLTDTIQFDGLRRVSPHYYYYRGESSNRFNEYLSEGSPPKFYHLGDSNAVNGFRLKQYFTFIRVEDSNVFSVATFDHRETLWMYKKEVNAMNCIILDSHAHYTEYQSYTRDKYMFHLRKVYKCIYLQFQAKWGREMVLFGVCYHMSEYLRYLQE